MKVKKYFYLELVYYLQLLNVAYTSQTKLTNIRCKDFNRTMSAPGVKATCRWEYYCWKIFVTFFAESENKNNILWSAETYQSTFILFLWRIREELLIWVRGHSNSTFVWRGGGRGRSAKNEPSLPNMKSFVSKKRARGRGGLKLSNLSKRTIWMTLNGNPFTFKFRILHDKLMWSCYILLFYVCLFLFFKRIQ